MNEYHKHYDTNTIGKDYIIGDLHGMYNPLMDALKKLKFNKSTDRLFSVGDIIDRGPDSFKCANLVYEDWFHMTIGNHEQMMTNTMLHSNPGYYHMWMNNGGLWHIGESDRALEDLSHKFTHLPLVISVGTEINRFNIVHAELVLNNSLNSVSDKDIDEWTFGSNDMEDMTWGREMVNLREVRNSYDLQNSPHPHITFQGPELSPTYCGHSTVKQFPCRIEQQIYLDTGFSYSSVAKFPEEHPLTIACPQDDIVYQYRNVWKTLTHSPITDIKRYK